MLIEFAGKRPQIGSNVFIAPTAILIGDVTVGESSSIWFNAVVRGDFAPIRIGAKCNIQDNVTIHVFAETVIGKNVTIGHNAVIEGCMIGDHTVVGINSTVLSGATVGCQVMIAAGSVILEHMVVPDRVLVAGVPAEIKSELHGNALAWTQRASREYEVLQMRYQSEGIGVPDGVGDKRNWSD